MNRLRRLKTIGFSLRIYKIKFALHVVLVDISNKLQTLKNSKNIKLTKRFFNAL